MKSFVLFIAVSLFAQVDLWGQTIQKTLVKSFNLAGIHAVEFVLPGTVEVHHWHQPYMRIEMHIELGSSSENLFKRLITTGRYNLIGTVSEGSMEILAPALVKTLHFSGGKVLPENFTYDVYLPHTVEMHLGELARKSR